MINIDLTKENGLNIEFKGQVIGADGTLLDYLNKGYIYVGSATPSTTPIEITAEDKVFYIAVKAGDYPNFGQLGITELTILKSEEGRWLKEGLGVALDVDEKLTNYIFASDIGIFSPKDIYDYPTLARIKEISVNKDFVGVYNTLKCTQIYASGDEIIVVVNLDDMLSGGIFTQSFTFIFTKNTGLQTLSKTISQPYIGMKVILTFDTDNYTSSEDIQLYNSSSRSLYVKNSYIKERNESVVLEGIVSYIPISNMGIFSAADVYKYPALGRIKSISYSKSGGAFTQKISYLNITNIYVSENNIIINVEFDGLITSLLFTKDNGIEIQTKLYVNTTSAFNGTCLTMEFDTDEWEYAEVFHDKSIPVNRTYFNGMMGYSPSLTATNNAVELLSNDCGSALGKDIFERYDIMRGFREFTVWSNQQLYLTYVSITGSSAAQIIINKNLRNNGSLYNQDIVVNAEIVDGLAVFKYDLAGTKVYAKYVLGGNTEGWNAQYVNPTTPVVLEPIHLNTLSLYDSTEVFQTLESFQATSLRKGLLGKTPFMKAPNAICNLEDGRTLESSEMYILNDTSGHPIFGGIDKEGKFLFWSNSNNRIYQRDSYDSQETVKYDLAELNDGFTNEIRGMLILPNNNLLLYEITEGDVIGGLWIVDRSDAENVSMVKTFTYRNKYQETVLNWGVEFVDNIIYLSEYGNSPSSSGIGTKGDATKLWKSEDYGMTWNELYDFKNLDENIIPDALHIHSVHYDRYWNRLWVNIGDDTAADGKSTIRTCWSDDGGATWSSKSWRRWFGEEHNSLNNIKGLSMYAAKDFIIMGGDDYQNCIYRSIRLIDDVILEPVFRYDNYRDRVTQYTARFKVLSNGMIVVALTHGDHLPHQTRIIGTFDGIKWYTLFSGIVESTYLSVPNFGVIEEYDGKVYFDYTSRDDNDVYKRHLMQFELPKVLV